MPFEDLTLEQLRAGTKEQLIDLIIERLKKMEKKELCNWIWTIKDIETQNFTFQTLTSAKDGPNGQIQRITTIEDILGEKTGEKTADWSYYPTGPVDEIVLTETNEEDKRTSKTTIKHFIDGRQPVILK